MAKYRFRTAINAATFPLNAVLQARTVLQPQLDTTVRNAVTYYGTAESKEIEVPQMYYCENIMPTAEGLQSVNYEKIIQGLSGAMDFDQGITLRDADENNFLFVPARGKNYVYNARTGQWVPSSSITGWEGSLITRAYVNGRTFICYEGLGVYEYNSTLGTFTHLALALPPGITEAMIRGIGSSSNYLISFTDITVYWSSLVDPLDFIPSLITGAGFSIPQDVKGQITAVLGISGGYVVYTAKNAVAAVYTNNSRAPFIFKEISNAGGVLSYEQVTSEQTSGQHYAWTTGGFQKISIQGAETISAAVNDFIAGRMYETYNRLTKQVDVHYTATPEFNVKLAYIGSRYVILSYSTSGDGFNYALVLDTVLKRWGKIKIDHVDCFNYPYPNIIGAIAYQDLPSTPYSALSATSYKDTATGSISDPPSKLTIGFLQQDGTVKLLRMDYEKDAQDDAVAIFGKFQLVRANLMTLQQFTLEGVYQDTFTKNPFFKVYAAAAIDGFKPAAVHEMKLLRVSDKLAVYAKRTTGLNVTLICEGTFALSSALLEVTNEGDR